MMWDMIGDIHGEATKLKKLLRKLGYVQKGDYYFHHPKRKVCFLGDYIDRGNEIIESLEIVKTMTAQNAAKALMGNHEFNYLAFITKRTPPLHPNTSNLPRQNKASQAGAEASISQKSLSLKLNCQESASKQPSPKQANPKQAPPHQSLHAPSSSHQPIYVRRHNKRHRGEIFNTLQAFNHLSDKGHSFIEWFYTLPIYLETRTFRAIHATWDDQAIKTLNANPLFHRNHHITAALIENFHNDDLSKKALIMLLKGITLNLPKPATFQDHEGNPRDYVRLAWWKLSTATYLTELKDNLAPLLLAELPKAKRIAALFSKCEPQTLHSYLPGYDCHAKPLFIGHFWLEQENIAKFNRTLLKKGQTPYLLKPNLCCLDFSAAQGGPLVAYRFNGEQTLNEKNFVWVT